ncbi:MAG: GH25 family lysozyme, partial [Planctomycetota bacterium]
MGSIWCGAWRSVLGAVAVVAASPAMAQRGALPSEGIDVSHWQGTINWTAVANDGIDYAFIKATEGVGFMDSRFASNAAGAQAAGLYVAPYHFARPGLNAGDAVNEANYFLQVAGGVMGDGYLPPVLDLEVEDAGMTKAQLTTWALDFAGVIENAIGIKPLIYTGSYFANSELTGDITELPLWIAQWGVGSPTTSYWDEYDFWQYTATGSVAGISGNVDRNVFKWSPLGLDNYVDDLFPDPAAPGDFDEDGDIDVDDIDLLADHMGDPAYDLTGNGVTNAADMTYMVEDIMGTAFGDATLDGKIDTGDLAVLAGNFSNPVGSWSQGDFNGDGIVNTGDLAQLAANFGYDSTGGLSATTAAVPEPATAAVLAMAQGARRRSAVCELRTLRMGLAAVWCMPLTATVVQHYGWNPWAIALPEPTLPGAALGWGAGGSVASGAVLGVYL